MLPTQVCGRPRVRADAGYLDAVLANTTVEKDQLALALGGAADHVWAVSFIVTNIPADAGDYVGRQAHAPGRAPDRRPCGISCSPSPGG